jgi:hypothetical protein
MPKLIKSFQSLKEKFLLIVCIFIGHSNIVSNCWGYVSCGRCGTQVGDTLAGSYCNSKAVIIGHSCDICKANYKKLTWKDKIFCPDPLKGGSL